MQPIENSATETADGTERASATPEIMEAGSVAVLVVLAIGSWSFVLAEAVVASG